MSREGYRPAVPVFDLRVDHVITWSNKLVTKVCFCKLLNVANEKFTNPNSYGWYLEQQQQQLLLLTTAPALLLPRKRLLLLLNHTFKLDQSSPNRHSFGNLVSLLSDQVFLNDVCDRQLFVFTMTSNYLIPNGLMINGAKVDSAALVTSACQHIQVQIKLRI